MDSQITSDSEAQLIASRYINLARMQTRGLDLGYLYVRLDEMATECDNTDGIPYFRGYSRVAAIIRRELKNVLREWRKQRAAEGDKEAQALLDGTCDPEKGYS